MVEILNSHSSRLVSLNKPDNSLHHKVNWPSRNFLVGCTFKRLPHKPKKVICNIYFLITKEWLK